jgi:uncharacterized protein (UPF0264 family)
MITRTFLEDGIFSVRSWVNTRLKKKRHYVVLTYRAESTQIAAIDPFDFTPQAMKKDRQLALNLARVAIEDFAITDSKKIFDFINDYFSYHRTGMEQRIQKARQELKEMEALKVKVDRAGQFLQSK